MDGLVYPDGSFRSRDEIRADLATRDTHLEFTTPIHHPPESFNWYQQEAMRRQETRREAVGRREHVEVQLWSNAPIILGLIGDVHSGGEDCEYDMFAKDIAFIRDHPQAYVLLFGDLADCYFFTPAVHEHLLNLKEQYMYMQAALDELRGKIIGAFGGNHCLWASRMGETFYRGWTERYNAHYFEGVAYVTTKVNDKTYRIVGSHKHRGYSVYNDSHASRRQVLDDAENADISITAHNHVKANARQMTKMHGGNARPIDYVALGSYSKSTGYSRVQGWHDKAPEEMGATFLVLFHDKKRVEVFNHREEVAERIAPYLK